MPETAILTWLRRITGCAWTLDDDGAAYRCNHGVVLSAAHVEQVYRREHPATAAG